MDDLSELLETTRVFSSLDEKARKRLSSKFTDVQLKEDDILFYQGDVSDSIYLLVSGKLAAELTTATGETRIVGYIDANETVGELGALSNEPRTLTVKVLKNSRLLKLSAKDFIELCHQYPSVMFATLHPIIARSKNLIRMLSKEKLNKHVVIIAANKHIDLEKFSEKLISYTKKYPGIVSFSDYHGDFDNKSPTTVSEKIKKQIASKKGTRKILYFIKEHDTPLAKYALKKADVLYITGASDATPHLDKIILDKVKLRRTPLKGDPNLILLYPEDVSQPINTSVWLSLTKFRLHHHVRMNNTKDFHRLLRFLRDKAVGLVLGGGGTRGWSHLGVIKALRESKIPIDIIGGTSAGAIAGACYAMHQSYQDAYDKFYNIVVGSAHSVSWRSLTWPAISIFNAKKFTKAQETAFGETKIEDLWLPYFCISANLTNNIEEIHTSGTLWEKTRASTSIPGVIPPMVINGELHLDGGLLNNLPVDIMRQYVGNKGKIIAVELNSYVAKRIKYKFPPILTLKEVLFSKWRIGSYQFKFPRFMDTFLRGVFMSSSFKVKQNSLAANIFISLDLSKYRLLNSNPTQAEGLVEIGYKGALSEIDKRKKDHQG